MKIKFIEFNLFTIKSTGFSILSVRYSVPMKNVKPEFKGIRNINNRSLFAFYSPKERFAIHVFFKMWIIKKQQNNN